MTSSFVHDVIIIGAGPGGLTAALYCARYKLSTQLFEKMSVGGQIVLSPMIDNFPGFPGGVVTHELMDRMHQQGKELGIEVVYEEVASIAPVPGSKPLIYSVASSENTYQTRSIIIATGAQSKRIGVAGEEKFIGRGVSYCGTCDGPLFKGKDIVVVGGGDRAIEEALFLSSYAKSVRLTHRRDVFRASEIIVEKAKANPRISFMLSTIIEEISGDDKVELVKFKNLKTGEISECKCNGVFIFVGIKPDTGLVKDLLKLDDAGFIITDEELNSSREGIFVCGDC
ncbi:MAG: FAD-dependent oxidoreductase, partial [Candidatus Omnitrophica bacterium]|nr:FAD-dependent oxidoreductase [Candidatus Omnitrophota bacterium]